MLNEHYVKERIAREKLINQIGIGTAVATFKVDRGHPHGAELHTITSTGIIVIRNAETNKLVTKLIARPNQIRRYFNKETELVKKLVAIAEIHQTKGYNKIWKRK